MPTPKKSAVKRLKSWSYSRFECYIGCPFKAMLKHIRRMQEPENKYSERGNLVHKLAEKYTLGKLAKLPNDLKRFKKEFEKLRKVKAKVEEQWCFTKDWIECAWNDWDNAWVRIKVDAHYVDGDTLWIIDHKTGRVKYEHRDQRTLYAVGGFYKYPKVKKIRAAHWYLDEGVVQYDDFTRDQLPGLVKDWERRTKKMLADTTFKPTPSKDCGWCHFRKENGGPCRY